MEMGGSTSMEDVREGKAELPASSSSTSISDMEEVTDDTDKAQAGTSSPRLAISILKQLLLTSCHAVVAQTCFFEVTNCTFSTAHSSLSIWAF